MSSINKMINAEMRVVKLKAAAKARGFKRYSKLRKAELLHLFDGTRMGRANENIIDTPVPNIIDAPVPNIIDAPVPNIIDAPVPNIPGPTLTPSSYVSTSYIRKIYDAAKSDLNTFANWLVSYIPSEPKRIVTENLEALKTKVNTLFNKLKKFEIRESNAAIKVFTKQYTINGMEGIEAVSFLNSVRPQVIS